MPAPPPSTETTVFVGPRVATVKSVGSGPGLKRLSVAFRSDGGESASNRKFAR
jgi:hypothetical protein